MGLNTKDSAALVFLILYAILFALSLLGFLTRRLKFCSRYGVILFYVTVRLASLAAGLGFGVVGYVNTSFIVAYFVLGGEAYYIIIVCTYCFVVSWQNHNFASDPWLEPSFASGTPWYKRLLPSFVVVSNRRTLPIMYILLLSANALTPTGGCMLVRDNNAFQQINRNTTVAKALRTAALATLLTVNIFLLYCVVGTIRQSRHENPGKHTHPTLLLLSAACALLSVRGLYGVMSGFLPAFNYFDPNNYGNTGFTSSFIISESIMVTAMEWSSCTLLMLTYFTSLNHPEMADLEMHSEGKKDQSRRVVEA